MTNSIERVKAALHFGGPDKVPVINHASLKGFFFTSDLVMATAFPSAKWRPGWKENEVGLFPHTAADDRIPYRWKKPAWASGPEYKGWQQRPREEVDEWGVIWDRNDKYVTMGHPGRPVLSDWSKLDWYLDTYLPDMTEKGRYTASVLYHNLFARQKYRTFTFNGNGPLTMAGMIRGFSKYMADHRRNPEKVKQLLGIITENFITQFKSFVKYGGKPHGIWMYEDLASQDRPFMNPTLFKEFYEKPYRELIGAAHDLGCEFHMHCCGKIDALIPQLIDYGLDALELDSPRMTGYANLQPFRGKIMFWACVNIQSIYVKGTPGQCEREVWHMMRNLGTPDGGFGAYYYPQANHIQAPKENVRAFGAGLKRFGTYASVPRDWWERPVPERWDENGVDIVPD